MTNDNDEQLGNWGWGSYVQVNIRLRCTQRETRLNAEDLDDMYVQKNTGRDTGVLFLFIFNAHLAHGLGGVFSECITFEMISLFI